MGNMANSRLRKIEDADRPGTVFEQEQEVPNRIPSFFTEERNIREWG